VTSAASAFVSVDSGNATTAKSVGNAAALFRRSTNAHSIFSTSDVTSGVVVASSRNVP
jgi:hypothetical protein